MNYIPLSIKTHYELLSSLIKVDSLLSFARDKNINALGVTDSNMFNSIEFINECNKNNVKAIIGVPFTLDNLTFTLYAKNYNGLINLMNLVSIRNINGLTKEDLINKDADLICTTSDYANYLEYKELYEEVYLSYKDKKEKALALSFTPNIVYINDSLYFLDSDEEYLKYLYLIRDSKTIDDIDSYSFDNALDKDIDESDAKTTIDFASKINIELVKMSFDMPRYSINSKELLRSLCTKGLNKRLDNNVPKEYIDRLNYELEVIDNMHFNDYFLIVYDFILYAKKHSIVVGPGRGSAAGSLVSYTLGITNIDPIKYGLLFERFLNKDRVTMPDIDTDIEYLRREEVVNYVKDKYGIDKVANIITFGSLLTKQALRDVSKILKIDNREIDEIVKNIKDKETIKDLENNKNFMNIINSKNEYKKLFRIAKKLEGIKRHTSIHAAGIVMSSDLLMNKVPLYKSNDTILTCYTGEYLESMGLLKMDLLALKNLTIIDSILNIIEKEYDIKININKIPLDDKKTLSIFENADTNGIFQFESEGMKSFLRNIKVKTFDDIVVSMALYRPGPKDNIPTFISVREGKTKVKYLDPRLEDILKETNGIIVYQEQIMNILKKIGGFSYSEADIIRRAMSKKKEEVIVKYRDLFIEGASNNGIDKLVSNQIYDLILKFASYGFNKSHSVSYSYLAYQMAYLKANFKDVFMMYLLNDSIGNINLTKEYIDDSKKSGIKFIMPNINTSDNVYKVCNKSIVYPLTIISKVKNDAVNEIMIERNNGNYLNYIDFVKRVYSSKVNEEVITNLIYSGSLDNLGYNRKTMIDNLSNIIEYASLCRTLGEETLSVPEIIYSEEMSEKELADSEYKMFGFYPNNHPANKYMKSSYVYLKDIKSYFNKNINISVFVEKLRETTTKKNEKMAFLTVSDETGSATLIVFPSLYSKLSINKGDVLVVNATVERRINEFQLVSNKIEKM